MYQIHFLLYMYLTKDKVLIQKLDRKQYVKQFIIVLK